MRNSERVAQLSQLNLFRGVSFDSIAAYVEALPEVHLSAGEVLLSPGRRNDRIFLLLGGRLRIHLDSPDESPLLVLAPGECVGEMSIIEEAVTSAFVVAETDCHLLVLDQETLWALVNASHGVARNLLHMLSKRVRFDNGVIVDGIASQRRWEHYATVDALTGVHNRRWLDDVLPRQLKRSRAAQEPLSLIMTDIDYFKNYNDRFGHLAGDRALCAVARVLREHLRPSDMAARFGGEEFVVLLPATAREDAMEIAERLRVAVAATPITTLEGQPLPAIAISIGVAGGSEEDRPSELLGAVDAALYRAKEGGRNRVSD
jgi:diguanylate cyclase (GGDEF)-like protein